MIAILDYGLGNIRAFANIYKSANISFKVASRVEDLVGASKIILPGVGAFDHAMGAFRSSPLCGVATELVLDRKVPVLGICVGMQMLACSSEEGRDAGLGWVRGSVKKIRFPAGMNEGLLPHMGWNTVKPGQYAGLFAGFQDTPEFYFLHSYYFSCDNEVDSLAVADYAGAFTCAVGSGNVFGVQFHPEKSHHNGIRLLENFARL